jgi:branched-chain amino acid transport system permease protein
MGWLMANLRQAGIIVRNEVFVLPSRIAVLVFVVALMALPLFTQDPYILRIFVLTSVFALLAASWDFLSGFTGQMNFGHALFFGVAAYTAAKLNLSLGALGGVLAGLVVGIPCLRLRGAYLALTTLAFPIIVMGVVFALPDFSGGELGISGLSRLASTRVGDYYITSIGMLVFCFAMWKITDSKTGIILHAIREDEVACRSAGINTTRYKLMAFCISGFFAGISGGFYAHFMRMAGPNTLEVNTSFLVIIWAVFGGMVTIYGPVAGVFILFPLLEFLRFIPQARMLVFAFMVLMTLLYMPEGLIPWIRDKIENICPRCKARNVATRGNCRVCNAVLD